jgi:DNA-binding NarL/FixJ family response regulator
VEETRRAGGTVDLEVAHVSRLFAKLGVTNRVQIAIVVHEADQA